jgi:glycerol uptake facilitator-like aquaporin
MRGKRKEMRDFFLPISHLGGHLNPSITLAVMCMMDISLCKGLMFFVCQICGSLAGAGILYGLVDPAIGNDRID